MGSFAWHGVVCALVFLVSYCSSLLYITVFYHRSLAHKSITLTPWLERWVVLSGVWITGLDPKAWVCMHRRHHAYSDTERDPHTPTVVGKWRIPLKQLRSYEQTLACLDGGLTEYTRFVKDLSFPVNTLFARRLWFVPYLTQALIAVGLGLASNAWAIGVSYWLGLMSHPVQGWLVNAWGHSSGSRNFDAPDNSRNNIAVAWLVGGEGLQNNHHAFPASARFSCRPGEPDLGFRWCQLLERLGLASIRWESLISGDPKRSAPRA